MPGQGSDTAVAESKDDDFKSHGQVKDSDPAHAAADEAAAVEANATGKGGVDSAQMSVAAAGGQNPFLGQQGSTAQEGRRRRRRRPSCAGVGFTACAAAACDACVCVSARRED